MLRNLHSKSTYQLGMGLIIGILFGFLLQKGGATRYEIIINQLLLKDFTVLKIMLSAVITGMLGIHLLKSLGLVQFHIKPGSFGSSVIGGIFFGIGFGLLGYCPGTMVGAIGQGSLDALFGGLIGVIAGSSLLAAIYPKIQNSILKKGNFGELTLPGLLKINPWVLVVPFSILLTGLLYWIERMGL